MKSNGAPELTGHQKIAHLAKVRHQNCQMLQIIHGRSKQLCQILLSVLPQYKQQQLLSVLHQLVRKIDWFAGATVNYGEARRSKTC